MIVARGDGNNIAPAAYVTLSVLVVAGGHDGAVPAQADGVVVNRRIRR